MTLKCSIGIGISNTNPVFIGLIAKSPGSPTPREWTSAWRAGRCFVTWCDIIYLLKILFFIFVDQGKAKVSPLLGRLAKP